MATFGPSNHCRRRRQEALTLDQREFSAVTFDFLRTCRCRSQSLPVNGALDVPTRSTSVLARAPGELDNPVAFGAAAGRDVPRSVHGNMPLARRPPYVASYNDFAGYSLLSLEGYFGFRWVVIGKSSVRNGVAGSPALFQRLTTG